MRTRGRILGPLTWAQLQAQRDRGQLARFDQVSQDRQNWIGADRVDGLFAPSNQGGPRGTAAPSDGSADFIILDDEDASYGPGPTGPSTADAPEWFFARGGSHQGPVPLSELQRMADTGEIDPETLVWRGGMEQWTPGSWVAELRFPARVSATPGRAESEGSPAPAGSRSADRPNPASRTSVLAISSLIMGVFWMFGLGSLAAIVLGAMSIRQISRSQGMLTGKRLAIAGIIVGIIGLVGISIAMMR
ncbi:MAG: GYF domain-containing protein [Isosphaeraceae bacterium]